MMFKTHLLIALRSFWKQKLITAINVVGLSIGIACASLGYIFIQHEWSFDEFHEEAENIYWLRTVVNNVFFLSSTPPALSPNLESNFPEVTESCRIEPNEFAIVQGKEVFKEEGIFVDDNFFTFFNFDLLSGDANTALSPPNAIVLTASTAKKYFGRQNPIGKNLTIYYRGEEILLEVTGVAAKAPSNSSVQFDFLLPLALAHKTEEMPMDQNWKTFTSTSLIRLKTDAEIADFQEKLPDYIAQQYPPSEDGTSPYVFYAERLVNYHFNSPSYANGLRLKANNNYSNILIIISLLILLVACFNFTNLSNAKGSQRLTEIGVRQVLGADRRHLRRQFLMESMLLSMISVVLAVGLIHLLLTYATQIFDYELAINWWSPKIILSLLGIAAITGFLAGIYPAFLLSNLKTVNTFKSNYKIGGNNLVTKTGLVFQFTLSIGLLACTFIMLQQQRYISNQNLGFEREAVVAVATQIQSEDGVDTDVLLERYKRALANHPGIKNVAGVSFSFTRGNSGRLVQEEGTFEDFVFDYKIDENYLDLLQIELLEGRNFSPDRPEDGVTNIIVNEEFKETFIEGDIASYKLPEAFDDLANATVIGVVKDYNFLDLKQSMNPLILHRQPKQRYYHFLVKIASDNVPETMAHLKASWQKVRPELPFEYSFLDEDIQRQYALEARWSSVITGATTLAIFIAFLGLFGLVALSLAQRTKEIGIRKVLGASLANIIALFSKDFVQLVLLSMLIAAPLAWYFMQQWLSYFAYAIQIQWWVFVLSGLAAIGIAVLTVSFQSIKAALANPVESLRNE